MFYLSLNETSDNWIRDLFAQWDKINHIECSLEILNSTNEFNSKYIAETCVCMCDPRTVLSLLWKVFTGKLLLDGLQSCS